jgi:hypothetical protein
MKNYSLSLLAFGHIKRNGRMPARHIVPKYSFGGVMHSLHIKTNLLKHLPKIQVVEPRAALKYK